MHASNKKALRKGWMNAANEMTKQQVQQEIEKYKKLLEELYARDPRFKRMADSYKDNFDFNKTKHGELAALQGLYSLIHDADKIGTLNMIPRPPISQGGGTRRHRRGHRRHRKTRRRQ